jgi:ribonuclease HI
VSRIADRLAPPPDLSLLDEETKESEPPDPARSAADEESKDDEPMDEVAEPTTDSDPHTAAPREWRLQFDGACRGGPNPGGAGALLYDPDGAAVWTGSHYMPGAKETNNTAEYTALLIGARAAADHGARLLRVEGDSLLVIRQVKGLYATKSTRLRQLRNAVRHELARVGQHSLHHIDRQGNAFADRLANRALDMTTDKIECKDHPVAGTCTTCLGSPSAGTPATPPPAAAAFETMDVDSDGEPRADIDDGEVYAPMRLEPGVIPARRSRLRLRQLTDDEMEAAGEVVERLSAALSAKIADAEDWETAEGYITALPYTLYDKLQPFTQARRGPISSPAPRPQRRDVQEQTESRQEPQLGATVQPEQPTPARRRRRGRRKGRRQRRHPRRTNVGVGVDSSGNNGIHDRRAGHATTGSIVSTRPSTSCTRWSGLAHKLVQPSPKPAAASAGSDRRLISSCCAIASTQRRRSAWTPFWQQLAQTMTHAQQQRRQSPRRRQRRVAWTDRTMTAPAPSRVTCFGDTSTESTRPGRTSIRKRLKAQRSALRCLGCQPPRGLWIC